MRAIVVLAFLALTIAPAVAAEAPAAPSEAKLIAAFVRAPQMYALPPRLASWDAALRKSLSEHRNLNDVARAGGLSTKVDLRLKQLWLRFSDLFWNERENEREDAATQEQMRRGLDRDFLALAIDSKGDPLVMAAATEGMTYIGRCSAEATDDARVLLRLVEPAVAWSLVKQSLCKTWLRAFYELAPQKSAAVLVEIADSSDLPPAARLAMSGLLSSHEFSFAASPRDTQVIRRRFAFRHISLLLKYGLMEEADRFWAALPQADRNAMLNENAPGITVTVDGLAISLPAEGSVSSNIPVAVSGGVIDAASGAAELREDLAAVRYLQGNLAAARELLPEGLLALGHTAMDCVRDEFESEKPFGGGCSSAKPPPAELALLDLALNRPGDDPFDFVVLAFVDWIPGSPFYGSDLWADALCKYLGTGEHRVYCGKVRRESATRLSNEDGDRWADRATAMKVVASAAPKLAGEISRYEAATKVAASRYGPATEPRESRTVDGPFPQQFAQERLRDRYRGKAPGEAAWINQLAPLPDGYEMVRADRQGSRVVAISLSQNYDPTGEVSAGGYWVHLSDDGGKSWRAPLYTGLADHYPYVVKPASRMPILDGDILNVEVVVDEIDLSSITYPPVALRSKRHEEGLYLKIPLAELTRDSDGDGLTDIVEKHLLLDPHNPDSDGDGVPDGTDMMPNVRQVPHEGGVSDALVAILNQLFDLNTGAIIEPVGDAHSNPVEREVKAATRRDPNSADRPIFVEGDKSDFAGFHPDKMMLVYGPDDLQKLARMSPDFHATSLSKAVMNRTRDKGFVVWSSGWTGGTIGIVRKETGWRFITLRSWIT